MPAIEQATEKWEWAIDLDPFLGRTGYLTTKDGVYRQGRISAVRMRELEVNGEVVRYPEFIELNGDTEDLIPFDRLQRLKVE